LFGQFRQCRIGADGRLDLLRRLLERRFFLARFFGC
jgi:hypothetical protein